MTAPATTAAGHTLIGPRYATASLPEDDYAGWYWKCTCGAKASSFIGNWPESEDEAREEWRLHFEKTRTGLLLRSHGVNDCKGCWLPIRGAAHDTLGRHVIHCC